MTEKWCEHITDKHNFFVSQSGAKYPIDKDWDICPVNGCHAPRPAPKKTMAQKLQEAYFLSGWDAVASRAKELILDGKEEGIFEILKQRTMIRDSERIFIAKEILTYLRESC